MIDLAAQSSLSPAAEGQLRAKTASHGGPGSCQLALSFHETVWCCSSSNTRSKSSPSYQWQAEQQHFASVLVLPASWGLGGSG